MTLEPAVIRRYLTDAKAAAVSDEKGKLYEELLIYLFEAVPGCIRNATSQTFSALNRSMLQLAMPEMVAVCAFCPHVILVECKDWGKPVGSSTGGLLYEHSGWTWS